MKEALNDAHSPPTTKTQDGHFVSKYLPNSSSSPAENNEISLDSKIVEIAGKIESLTDPVAKIESERLDRKTRYDSKLLNEAITLTNNDPEEQKQQRPFEERLAKHLATLRANIEIFYKNQDWYEAGKIIQTELDGRIDGKKGEGLKYAINEALSSKLDEVVELLRSLSEEARKTLLDKSTYPRDISQRTLEVAQETNKGMTTGFQKVDYTLKEHGDQLKGLRQELNGVRAIAEGAEKKAEGVEKVQTDLQKELQETKDKLTYLSPDQELIFEEMARLKDKKYKGAEIDPNDLYREAVNNLLKRGVIRNCFTNTIPDRELAKRVIQGIERAQKEGKKITGLLIKETYNNALDDLVREKVISEEEAKKLGPLEFYKTTEEEVGESIKRGEQIKNLWIIHNNHASKPLEYKIEGNKVYVKVIDENINGKETRTRWVELSKFADEHGEILILANKEYKFKKELSKEEQEMIDKFESISDGNAGGTADGQGGGGGATAGTAPEGGGPTGPGGDGLTGGDRGNGGGPTGPDGSGATVPAGSSPLGRGDGTDGIPRNTPAKAMDTRLPKNNGVITGNNNIGKDNVGQASSVATPDNILNLNPPSEQYNGINYKGIVSSPVTNTGTGEAPPGKAINALFASLDTPTSWIIEVDGKRG